MNARTEIARNAQERKELLGRARRIMQELLVATMLPDEEHLARLDLVAASSLLNTLGACQAEMTRLRAEYAELVALS